MPFLKRKGIFDVEAIPLTICPMQKSCIQQSCFTNMISFHPVYGTERE